MCSTNFVNLCSDVCLTRKAVQVSKVILLDINPRGEVSRYVTGIPQRYLRPVESRFPKLLGLSNSAPLSDIVVIVRIVKG